MLVHKRKGSDAIVIILDQGIFRRPLDEDRNDACKLRRNKFRCENSPDAISIPVVLHACTDMQVQ